MRARFPARPHRARRATRTPQPSCRNRGAKDNKIKNIADCQAPAGTNNRAQTAKGLRSRDVKNLDLPITNNRVQISTNNQAQAVKGRRSRDTKNQDQGTRINQARATRAMIGGDTRENRPPVREHRGTAGARDEKASVTARKAPANRPLRMWAMTKRENPTPPGVSLRQLLRAKRRPSRPHRPILVHPHRPPRRRPPRKRPPRRRPPRKRPPRRRPSNQRLRQRHRRRRRLRRQPPRHRRGPSR